jgi:hypothetical protein
VYITRVRVRTHEPTPECVCELENPIRVRRSPPRTWSVLYGVESTTRSLTVSRIGDVRTKTIIKLLFSFSFLIIGLVFEPPYPFGAQMRGEWAPYLAQLGGFILR